MLPEHLRALRRNAWISRLPGIQAALLRSQLVVQVLDLEAHNHAYLPGLLMSKFSLAVGHGLDEIEDQHADLDPYQWRTILKDNVWTGRILLQCSTPEETRTIYNNLNGQRVCIDNNYKTTDISSPTNVFLSSEASLVASSASSASPPGAAGTGS